MVSFTLRAALRVGGVVMTAHPFCRRTNEAQRGKSCALEHPANKKQGRGWESSDFRHTHHAAELVGLWVPRETPLLACVQDAERCAAEGLPRDGGPLRSLPMPGPPYPRSVGPKLLGGVWRPHIISQHPDYAPQQPM